MTQAAKKTAPNWFVALVGFAVIGGGLVAAFELIRGMVWLFSSPATPVPAVAAADEASGSVATAQPLPTPPAPYVPGETEAWVMSKRFVTTALKSPSTADFGGILENHQDPKCTGFDGGTWKCVGWVDAQNGFGATVRSDFAITIKWVSPGEWADPRSWIVASAPTVLPR